MFTTPHPQVCRCNLHRQIEQRQLEARRHARYRQLANAILGPAAPRDDAGLTRALTEHANLIRMASKLTSRPDVRAA
jgi:hypothetical protein